MIEVEIRGRLTESEYESLKRDLGAKGEFVAHLEREMYLFSGYAGYSGNFTDRATDIRLRNTNGECELMVKQKAGEGREETSLKLQDRNLDKAKLAMRVLGFTKALKMERSMDLFRYREIEWQIVRTPKGLWYWEAEQGTVSEDQVQQVHDRLIAEADALGLRVMTPAELTDFIALLDREVNVEVDL